MTLQRNDLTSGNVVRKFILFAVPIIAMNLFQAVYNLVDMIIVGQFAGAAAMSAVSIGGQVTQLVLVIAAGLSNGTSVYVGQLTGAGEQDAVKRYVGTMLSFITLLALGITAALIALRTPLLRALHTPDENFGQTLSYLTIYAAGTVFVYTYNVLSAALRGKGESVVPLVVVVVSSLENIVLDLLFVAVLHMDAAGAAIATVISQFTCVLLTAIAVKRRGDICDFTPAGLKIDSGRLMAVLRIGLPQAIQFTCTNISFLLISSLVNSYGVAASAAAGAANKIGTFGLMPGQACMTAIVSTTAQNLPKKNYKRILQSLLCGIVIAASISTILILFCELIPGGMYRIFTDDLSVQTAGIPYLRIYCISFFIEVIMFCLFGVLTGSGYTLVTMIAAVSQAFFVRLVVAYCLSRFTPMGFSGIAAAYPIAPLVGITISLWFLLSGRWKRAKI